MAKWFQLRRSMCEVGLTPCCLLAFRNRLATQLLNQDDKIGIPGALQDGPWCPNIIRQGRLPEYYRISTTDKNHALWLPFNQKAKATPCNQTRLQNQLNVRMKLFKLDLSSCNVFVYACLWDVRWLNIRSAMLVPRMIPRG